jgi:hypothetical protein
MLVPMPPHPDMPAGYERDAEAIATYQAFVRQHQRREALADKAVMAARFLTPWPVASVACGAQVDRDS